MADNTIEIVIKADGTQAIANINKIRQAITEVDQKATTGKVREEFAQLQKVGSLVQRELTSTFKTIGVTGTLLSGGLVAGLVMAGRALADFGRQGLELHHLSRELGVGAESLMRWKLAGQAAGLTAEQASADVNSAMRKLQELGRRGGYSELYTQLAESTADLTGRNLAQALYREVQSGGPEQGFRFLLQKLQEYAKSGNRWGVTTVSNILSLSPGWEHSIDLIDKIGKVYVVSEEKAQRYQLSVTLLGQQLSNLQTEIGSELLPVFAEMADQLRSWLQTPEGQKFQADLVKMARELENLPWKDIREGAESTIKFIKIVFEEGTKVIQSFIWTFQQGIDAYNKFRDWNRRKLRDEIEAGLHGQARRDLQSLPGGGRGAPGPYGGNTAGIPGLPGSPSGPAGGRRADQNPSYDLSPEQIERLRRRGGQRGGNSSRFFGVMGASGDGATEFSSVNRRQQSTEDLNDQMRDVTDEVRRLNDLLRGGGDVARTPGGGAGGMGPTGSRSSSSSNTSSNNPQPNPNATSAPFDPRTGYDPRQPGNAPAGQTPSLIGPGGAPMPPWGATTADFGGGTGGGAAGGVPGLAGGPSGRALTPDERKAAAGPQQTGAPLPGGTGSSAIYNKLLAAYQNSSVIGTIPKDGARYGFKTGSAEEWARFAMIIAASESDYNPKTAVSNSKEQSFGIFQYNHPQVPGGNAFDVDASVKAFVRDSESSMKTHGSLGPGSILYRRFSTIQKTPPPHRASQADRAIQTAKKQPVVVQPQSKETGPSALPPPGTVPPGSPTTAGVQPAANTPNNNPQPSPQGPHEGSVTTEPGARQGYDYYQSRGVQPGQVPNVTVQTPYGPIRVAKEAAGDFQGFFNDLAAAGAPLGKPGSYNVRQKRYSRGWSSHSYSTAIDLDDQVQISPKMRAWILANPERWRQLKEKWNLGQPPSLADPKTSGTTGKDPAHVEWRGPRPVTAEEAKKVADRKATNDKQNAAVNNTPQQNPHSAIPAILQPRQGVPLASTGGGGVGGDAARDAKIAKMRDDAAGVQRQSRDNDAAADREKVDRGLRDQINKATVSGKANIDITVKSDAKGSGDDSKLFNTTRTKSAPQMPNTPSDGDGDRSSTSDED